VKRERVTRADKNLEDITLQRQVDERKEQLDELRDIFHNQNKPCSRLILIMGGPVEYYGCGTLQPYDCQYESPM